MTMHFTYFYLSQEYALNLNHYAQFMTSTTIFVSFIVEEFIIVSFISIKLNEIK